MTDNLENDITRDCDAAVASIYADLTSGGNYAVTHELDAFTRALMELAYLRGRREARSRPIIGISVKGEAALMAWLREHHRRPESLVYSGCVEWANRKLSATGARSAMLELSGHEAHDRCPHTLTLSDDELAYLEDDDDAR